ncbi:MAG: hypothetical protein DNFNHJIP_00414 [Candidatus Argoarchaeum ethanivorans]|uniref:Uncharacterized protein n=1 Tax=Candidatus Argoarchaeum ethanivorans TaxID=2608793 RepID=A0A812A0E6_9EURY|nr:MAG: hypothetical protein DNFNHJIP_00414 [Candidatus Argoarchaeum ethanivorans]
MAFSMKNYVFSEKNPEKMEKWKKLRENPTISYYFVTLSNLHTSYAASQIGRVKKRLYGLPLLIKPLVQISRKRLSFGLSHHRKWIHYLMLPPVSIIQQLFYQLHIC